MSCYSVCEVRTVGSRFANAQLQSCSQSLAVIHRTLLRRCASTTVDEAARSVTAGDDGSFEENRVSWIERQLASEYLESTPKQRCIVAMSFGLNFWLLGRSVLSVGSWHEAMGALFAAFGGYLAADFFSGVYHWSVDNYGTKNTPVFGSQIDGFQRHHLYPWTITHRELCNNIHTVCLPALPFSAFLLLAQPPSWMEIFGSVGCMLVILSQQFHAWSHTKKRNLPSWVLALQEKGILISTTEHCRHHRSPFDINYSIVSGIWNPFLNAMLPPFEKWLHGQTGVAPRCWKEASVEDDVDYFGL